MKALIVLLFLCTYSFADTNSIPNIEHYYIDTIHDHLQKNYYLTLNKKSNVHLTGDFVKDFNFNSLAHTKVFTTIKIPW